MDGWPGGAGFHRPGVWRGTAIAGPVPSYSLNAFSAYKNINLGLAILLVSGLTCFGLCLVCSDKSTE